MFVYKYSVSVSVCICIYINSLVIKRINAFEYFKILITSRDKRICDTF